MLTLLWIGSLISLCKLISQPEMIACMAAFGKLKVMEKFKYVIKVIIC